MSGRPYVFDATRDDAELARLKALEHVFDAATRRCLLESGLQTGWRCLEVGAGAGSIAAWLAGIVGSTGRVLAVDVNPRFLRRVSSPNLQVLEADIREAPIERESFDLVHARFVLIHVPQWREALAAMISALKPGGWLVLEEPDFSLSRSIAGRADLRGAFDRVHQAIESMFHERGMDHAFGARIPALLEEHGLEHLWIENDAAIVRGDSAQARMMAMSAAALAEKYVATGRAAREDIDRYAEFASDPRCWATYHGTIRGMGRKPQ